MLGVESRVAGGEEQQNDRCRPKWSYPSSRQAVSLEAVSDMLEHLAIGGVEEGVVGYGRPEFEDVGGHLHRRRDCHVVFSQPPVSGLDDRSWEA